ncbi:MAG: CocE/NonD family hydrolase [Chloroflexi bacterium]|nr:CocE/NonD family hydrolase [Chloroflexota bacterium]
MNSTQLGTYAPAARFSGRVNLSYYVLMRDGVKLAVDVLLPKNLPSSEKIPAILIYTRYWRLMELRAPFKWFLKPEQMSSRLSKLVPYFTSHGYAIVLVDVRGTGASFGVWQHPWTKESIDDACTVIDWIVAQPWSNGNVGGTGVSYVGTTTELLGVINHPAVKALLPMFNHPDAFIDIAFPGGVFNERFIRDWSDLDWVLDQNRIPGVLGALAGLVMKGVKPVDGAVAELAQAVQEHHANGKVFELASQVTFRDDSGDGLTTSMEEMAVHQYKTQVEQSNAAVMGWGSWMDGGTADAVIRRFMTFPKASRAFIGAWEHGGLFNASPYRAANGEANPPIQTQLREMHKFFDAYLNGVDTGAQSEKRLFYFTLGAEQWQSTTVWPPAGTTMQRWYLQSDHALAPNAPTANEGTDKFIVDYEATTGDLNRWWEIGGIVRKAVTYRDRTPAAQHLLTYVSAPLERDTEITGHPIVKLFVTSTETDGAFIVYLEDVDEQSNTTYITEGELRAIHRKVANDPAPYKLLVPYHTYKAKDAMPLVPGEIAELHFGLYPTSVLVRQGHRIRVGIAGHDKGTFPRYPSTGTPTITLAHNRIHASWIELPVIEE